MNRKIKSLMIAKGIKQADIARELDITRGTVSGAISGYHKSEAVMQKLSALLGVPYHKLEQMWTRSSPRLKKAA